MAKTAAAQMHAEMVAAGFRRDSTQVDGFRYVGALSAGGRQVEVAFHFNDLHFVTAPVCQILDPQALRDGVAHIDPPDGLCYIRQGTIVLDKHNVSRTVATCVRLAQVALEDVLSKKDHSPEIAAEFPQHWHGYQILVDWRECGKEGPHVFEVPMQGWEGRMVLSNAKHTLSALGFNEVERKQIWLKRQKAVVIEVMAPLTFIKGQRRPETLAEFMSWGDTIEIGLGAAIMRVAASGMKNPPYIFIRATNGCVGASIKLPPLIKTAVQSQRGLVWLLNREKARVELVRYSGQRMDPPFIFSRNTHMDSNLSRKKIALVGCGTIGSHLAKFLSQSGAGSDGGALVLCDNQTLTPGNVGRHLLGVMHVGRNKAEACKDELLRLFPESSIRPVDKDALEVANLLLSMDLVIDATGEEALSVVINENFVKARREGRKCGDALFVWLLGNGVATQALLTISDRFACYDCLRPRGSGSPRLSPLRPDYVPLEAPAACGEGQFMPYGVAAPAIAAGLAMKMVLDWAAGHAKPLLRSVRIENSVTKRVDDQSPTPTKGCRTCGQ